MSLCVRVQYFAALREQRGVSDETLETAARTVADLYTEIATRHGLSLPQSRLNPVINEEFRDWTTKINDGDTIVFIPPVAGG